MPKLQEFSTTLATEKLVRVFSTSLRGYKKNGKETNKEEAITMQCLTIHSLVQQYNTTISHLRSTFLSANLPPHLG